MEQVLVMRPELLKALFKLWEVDNVDDLMREINKYEADKQLRASFTNADPTLTVFYSSAHEDGDDATKTRA